VIGALAGGEAAAEKDGIDSTLYYMGAIGCGGPQLEGEGCHVNPESDLVTVTIEGPSEITGSAELYTATAQTSIPSQQGSGINVLIDALASTSDCQLDRFPTPEDDQLQFIGPVLSHRDAEAPPPTGSIGVFSYSFLLKDCTVPGTIRLLVAMNTFNGDGESTDDAWNQSEKTITVPEPGTPAGGAALAGLLGLAAARRRRA
jgi:MYXO-CTERM domain-containing protein